MIKIGREEPVASMDGSGKIIWAKHNEIQTVNVRAVAADSAVLYKDHDTWFVLNEHRPGFISIGYIYCKDLIVNALGLIHLLACPIINIGNCR
jgi:hypothetical protein